MISNWQKINIGLDHDMGQSRWQAITKTKLDLEIWTYTVETHYNSVLQGWF